VPNNHMIPVPPWGPGDVLMLEGGELIVHVATGHTDDSLFVQPGSWGWRLVRIAHEGGCLRVTALRTGEEFVLPLAPRDSLGTSIDRAAQDPTVGEAPARRISCLSQ